VADLIKTKRTREPKRLVVDEALNVLAPDQRQILAELRSMEIEQHAAMPRFLVRHLIEDLGGGRIVLAQSLCEAAVDAAVLFLVGDSEREDLLLSELGEGLHVGLESIGARTARRAYSVATWRSSGFPTMRRN